MAVLAGGLVLRRAVTSDELAPVPSASAVAEVTSGAQVGRYFVPSALPGGYALLGVDEGAALPSAASLGRAVYATDEGGRVSLRVADQVGRWSTSDNTLEIEGGIVRWTLIQLPELDPLVMFQVDRGDVLIDGDAKGIDEAEWAALFEATDVDEANGMPTVSDSTYQLRSAQSAGTPDFVAESTAFYGPPGGYFGMAGIEVRVRRYSGPVDPDLEAGVWDNRTSMNGRSIMLGMWDGLPWWMPSPDTIVSVQVSGDLGTFTAGQVLGTLTEVDAAAFQAAVDQIATTADGLIATETVTFPGGAVLDLYGPEADARGLCLTLDGRRHCDLALMRRSGYTDDDHLAATTLDALIGQRWYTIGLTQDAATLDSSVELADGLSGTWYLIAHPDDAMFEIAADGVVVRTRPAR